VDLNHDSDNPPEIDFSVIESPQFPALAGALVRRLGRDNLMELDYDSYCKVQSNIITTTAGGEEGAEAAPAGEGRPEKGPPGAARHHYGAALERIEKAIMAGDYSDGSGYDSEDSFIDNAEEVRLRAPQRTKYGRFFVYDPEQADPDDILEVSESSGSSDAEDTASAPKSG
jgi:hypothetical protein